MTSSNSILEWLGDDLIRRYELLRDQDGFLPPPWMIFPSYPPTSMGWRMGDGETYWSYWHWAYGQLTKNAQLNYRRRYPAPLYWYWAYYDLDSLFVAAFIAVSGIMTWPIRYLIHLAYKQFGEPAIQIPQPTSQTSDETFKSTNDCR